MQNTMKSILVVGSLLLGSAQATGISTGTTASASAEVRSAVLLNAQGRTVGTINQAGQVVAGGALHTATKAQVTFQGGATRTFTLVKNIGTGARANVETVIVRSGNSMVSLGNAIRADVQARAANQTSTALQGAQALRGKTVVLVNASGETVGTFMADGSIRVMGDLRQASDVVVTLGSGQKITYDLVAEVSNTANTLANIRVSDQGRSTTLVSVLATLNHAAAVSGDVNPGTGSVSGGTNSGAAGQVSGGASAGISGEAGSTAGSAGGRTGIGVSIGVGVGGGVTIGGGK